MHKKQTIIRCRSGLHARPAKLFALAAQKFRADIKVEFDGRKVEGKSIISLLQLGIPKGGHLWIHADGEDEEEAVSTLFELLGDCD